MTIQNRSAKSVLLSSIFAVISLLFASATHALSHPWHVHLNNVTPQKQALEVNCIAQCVHIDLKGQNIIPAGAAVIYDVADVNHVSGGYTVILLIRHSSERDFCTYHINGSRGLLETVKTTCVGMDGNDKDTSTQEGSFANITINKVSSS